MPSSHLILCRPLLLLPPIPPSIRVFSNESTLCMRWIRVSASASVLPRNTQDWSPLGWTGWISLQSKGLSRVFSNTTVQKHQFFSPQLSSQSNSHIHTWLLGVNWPLSKSSVQFSSVTQLCPTLCDPISCSTPCFPVHQQLPELAQTHVHQVGKAIQ